MNCKQTRKNLNLWLTGELSDEVTQAVDAHLTECPECAEEFRFQKRLTEQMSGSAMPDPTMRYRLETELDEVDAGRNVAYEKMAAFGANLMKKAVWPVTAAMVAVGTYTVMFPQGALAEAWKDRLSAAQEGADEARNDDNVYVEKTSDSIVLEYVGEDGGLATTTVDISADSDDGMFIKLQKAQELTESERAFMKALKVHNNVSRNNDDVEHDWKVEFDKSKYESVKGEKPGIQYVVPKGDSTLRAAIKYDPETNQLESISFERRVDGKWTMYGQSFHGNFGDGFKGMDLDGFDIDFDMDEEMRLKIEKQFKNLKDNEFYFEMDSEKMKKMMEEHKLHFEKLHGDGFLFKMDDVWSPEERAKFEAEMAELQERLKTLKGKDGRQLTDEERVELEKAMKELEKELGNLKFDFKFDGEGMMFDMQGLKELKALGELEHLEHLKELKHLDGLHNIRVNNMDGVYVVGSISEKDGKRVEKWDVKFDEEKWTKKAGPADNVTYLVSKDGGDKRMVITRERKDGKVTRIQRQKLEDGKWVTTKTTNMSDLGRDKNIPPQTEAAAVLS